MNDEHFLTHASIDSLMVSIVLAVSFLFQSLPLSQLTLSANSNIPYAYEAAGTRSFLTDGLGSTVALMNSGGVQAQYTYEPFGKSTSAAGSNPFQYTGRENDGTGLYYYRARYYHPTLQRFISEDPIEFAGGDLNLYAYAFNSPLNYTDPDGENPLVAAIGAACAGGAALGVGIDFGFAALSGRKFTWGDAGRSALGGCAGGLIGLGLGKALTVAGKGLQALGEAGVVRIGNGTVRKIAQTLSSKIERQMIRRGWSRTQIQEAIGQGQQVRAINKATRNPATRYIHPKMGQSVVVDDVTGEIIHVGGPEFKYGLGSGDLAQ